MKSVLTGAFFGMIAAIGAALIIGGEQSAEQVVIVVERNSPILNDGYLACTMPALLHKGIVDNVQCMGTSDLQKYTVVEVKMHSDKTAEVFFDLQDDTTAILWVPIEAVQLEL